MYISHFLLGSNGFWKIYALFENKSFALTARVASAGGNFCLPWRQRQEFWSPGPAHKPGTRVPIAEISGVGIVWVWGLSTLLSLPVCRRLARFRGDSPGLFTLMALLLGPGAIPLSRKASPRPEFAQALAVVSLFGGLSTTMFLLFHTALLQYAEIFWGMSLVLPIPLYAVLHVASFVKSGALGPIWFLFNLIFPWFLYELALRLLRTDARNDEELAIQLLWNWAKLLPVLALCVVFYSLLAFALLEPLRQSIGWIGG